jgi:hypothetical protein
MADSGHVEPALEVQYRILSKRMLRLAVEKSPRDIVRLNLPLIV